MDHWKKITPPYAQRWEAVLALAASGVIHGMQAHAVLDPGPGHVWFPADTAEWLRDMVGAGELVPLRKDMAGAGHSVRAFRGLQNLRDGPERLRTVDWWLNGIPNQSADAHLWTFRLARGDEG